MVAEAETADEIPLFALDDSDGTAPLETEVATYDLSSEEVTEQLLLEAISFQRVGLEDQALAQVTAILAQHPGHIEAQLFLHKLETRRGTPHFPQATSAPVDVKNSPVGGLELLKTALFLDVSSAPSQSATVFEPGAELEASFDVTLNRVSQQTAATPTSSEDPDLEIAHFFLKQGLTQEARDELDNLLARDPVHAGALMLRGMLDEMHGADDAMHAIAPSTSDAHPPAVRVATDASEAERNDAQTHLQLGRACREMGALSDAIREFALARVSPKQAIEAEILMGLCHVQGGQFDEAARIFAHALETCGAAPEVLLQLRLDVGQALLLGHKPRHAAQFLGRVVRDAPGLTEAQHALHEAEALAPESTDPADQVSEHYALAALLTDTSGSQATSPDGDLSDA